MRARFLLLLILVLRKGAVTKMKYDLCVSSGATRVSGAERQALSCSVKVILLDYELLDWKGR